MRITYIHHSGFLVETEHAYLLFDYTDGNAPELLKDKPLVVFASHRHGDHYAPVIFEIGKEHGHVLYVLSFDIWRKRLPEEVLPAAVSLKYGETGTYVLEDGRFAVAREGINYPENAVLLKVRTFRSTDEGVAFLVEVDGNVIYHAGDLNNWTWNEEPKSFNESMARKYTEQVDQLAGTHVDVAFLPLDPRQEENFYLGMDEFLRKVDVDFAFPMHCWGDFSVTGRLKAMECSAAYRDKIIEIHEDGEVFTAP